MSLNPIDLDLVSPNALYAARSARLFARRRSSAFLDACSPRIVLPAAVLMACCYALLVLTGVGPQSWQARLCQAGGPRPATCETLPSGRAIGATSGLDLTKVAS